MSQQPGTSQFPVALASFFLVVCAGLFALSFYLFDGVSFVTALLPSSFELPSASVDRDRPKKRAEELVLPQGMPRDFALRLWQEQLDSQQAIGELVNGQVQSLSIDRVEKIGDQARLFVTLAFVDGSRTGGTIGLRRFGDVWYVANATADREVPSTERPLPDIDEVDVGLLNTMIAENQKSQSVINEYLDGIVKKINVTGVTAGPQTVTMDLEMDESHGGGYANLVAIRREAAEEPIWFLTRFTKTGDATATP